MRLKNFVLAGLPIALSSCALDVPSNVNVRIPDMTATAKSSALAGNFFSLQRGVDSLYNPPGMSTPKDAYSFSCYGVLVLASDLPQFPCGGSSGGQQPMPYHGGLVPGSGGTVSLQVPSGPQRNIKLFGVMSTNTPNACPSMDTLNIQQGGGSNSGPFGTNFSDLYDLGGKTVDIFADQSVAITPYLNTSNPVTVGASCNNSFSPTSLTGLQLWLKGSSFSSGTTAGNTAISGWPDASSNNWTSTVSASGVTADTTSLKNGSTSVAFSGSGSDIAYPANSALTNSSYRVVSVVAYPQSTTGTGPFPIYSESNATSSNFLSLSIQAGGNATATVSAYSKSTTGSVTGGWHLLTLIWSSSSVSICVDGACSQAAVTNATQGTADRSVIGANWSSPSYTNNLIVNIAELVVYNSSLTQDNVNALECYLWKKYSQNLPANPHNCQ